MSESVEMDMFSVMRVEVFLLLPVVLYVLFFKKSLYLGRDCFYPLKFFLAQRIVTAAQAKRRKTRERLLKNNAEPAIAFTSQRGLHYQTFSACDQKGNSLKLKFVLKPCKTAEVILILKLSNGRLYTFPGGQNVLLTGVKDFKWKVNGLSIETLEPYKRLRVVFNGLLQDISCESQEKVDHVQFNFIFNCCSAPKFYPEDCDSSLLAESLATRPWRDSSWKEFLDNHTDGYEQFGTLFGVVSGDTFETEQVLNLSACRTKYRFSGGDSLLDRELKLFLVEANGILIHLTLQTYQNHNPQLSYGYVLHKDLITTPVASQDCRIEDLAPDGNLPDLFMVRVIVKADEYSCVIYLNKSEAVKQTYPQSGCNVFAECNVNRGRGNAIVELRFCNRHKPSNRRAPPILSEKKAEVLPPNIVVNIRSDHAHIVDLVGGKGNSLALLASLQSRDFLVPDGFILTVNSFQMQLFRSKLLQEAIANIEDTFCGRTLTNPQEVCLLAVRLFTNEPVHPEVAAHVIDNLAKIKSDTIDDPIDVVSWAIRSSAIGEDSEELSAAGQNETILGCVTDAEVLTAISRCWASLFTFQSVQYRWQHGLPINSNMAVVVQKMVPADAAGVLFTWHPTTSNPSQMVVTSNFGLGESVVSGKSEPDTFILSRTYRGDISLVDRQIGTKNKVFTLTEDGVKEITTFDVQDGGSNALDGQTASPAWSLTEEQVLQLGKLGVSLEEAFGGPRDIEWSFYKGYLYLLQSRPITTLTNWTDFELTHEQDTTVVSENSLYTTANTGEVFPAAVSPLCRSATLPIIDRGMQANVNGSIERYFLKSMSMFSNRAFIDCIFILYATARTEEIQMSTKVLDLAVFGHPVMNERIVRMVRDRLGPMSRLSALKSLYKMWQKSRNLVRVVEKCKEYVNVTNYNISVRDSAEVIYEKVTKSDFLDLPSFSHSFSSQISVFWQIICMMVLVGQEKELTNDHYADFANILSSCEDVESAEVPLHLSQIASIIRDEGYSDEFCAIKPEFGVDWLKTKCPAAYKMFDSFLRKHGHRCIGEFDLVNETWGMNPCQLIPMIQANARHMTDTKKVQKSVTQVIRELVSPMNVVGRTVLKYALKKLRSAVGKREQTKSALILALQKNRLAFRQLAKSMVSRGLLPSENLIYFLTEHELGEILKAPNPVLISKAVRRQKLYPKWSNLRFSELSYGLPQPENDFEIHAELLPGSKCQGTPVCTGSVKARACVIVHLDEIGVLEKGDVLITYSTDIGWTPYFPMLSGIVTEIGGLVSHGAVVAREYGLPCVVGVKNATKLFRTGDIVFLSGKTGELGKV